MPQADRLGEKTLRGIPVSGGVCRGKVLVLGKSQQNVPSYNVEASQIPAELERFENALIQTRREIVEVQQQVTQAMGADHGNIFEAHLLVLEDHTLIDEVIRVVNQQQINVELALKQASEKYMKALASINDDYLRERASDMRDVIERIMKNLLGGTDHFDVRRLTEQRILIGYDLPPSTTALLNKDLALGFATDIGTKTSHTAILARSLQIPAVVGVPSISQVLRSEEEVLLDGYNGLVILNPTDQALYEYGQLVKKKRDLQTKLGGLREQPAVTLDGVRRPLSANIERVDNATQVNDYGADGVGLFRTEYLFINRESLPSEEEQYESYRNAAATLRPHPIVIRTLDLGGDKLLSHLQVPTEVNPFLGWRAIRFCLQQQPTFCAQLRAILRAGAENNVKLMYPMITCLDEIKEANSLVAKCKDELRRENIAFDEAMPIGAMIETPAAAIAANHLAKSVDFFSIGTNDLIQYSLAVDRLNEKIAHLYEPTHPAILQLIKMTVKAAHDHGISVSLCGEMAGDPVLVPLLLGLGVDELSAAPPLIPSTKYLIRRLRLNEAKELADFALHCQCGQEIYSRCEAFSKKIAPSLFEN